MFSSLFLGLIALLFAFPWFGTFLQGLLGGATP